MQFTTFDLFKMLLKEKTNTLIALFKMNEKKKEKDRKKRMHCLNVSNSPCIIKTPSAHLSWSKLTDETI